MKNVYTDGYKITSTMVIAVAGTSTTHGGMCFGVDAATNGGYCHIYETSNAGDMAVDGHYVKWLSTS